MKYPFGHTTHNRRSSQLTNAGFSLIEALVAVSITTILVLAIVELAAFVTRTGAESTRHVVAIGLANERIEEIRALPYSDIGTVGGNPAGTLPANETITRDNKPYTVETTIAWVDWPGNWPPGNDYKTVHVRVSWTAATGNTRDVALTTLAVDLDAIPPPQALLDGTSDIYVVGAHAYVTALSDGGVEVIDISNSAAPTHVGSIDDTACGPPCILDGPQSIFVRGARAHIAGNRGIEILDISNPNAHRLHS